QTAVQQVLDDRGDAGDGEGVAHVVPPLRRRRYSSSDMGCLTVAAVCRRGFSGAMSAVSSTRPIWMWTSGTGLGGSTARGGAGARATVRDGTDEALGPRFDARADAAGLDSCSRAVWSGLGVPNGTGSPGLGSARRGIGCDPRSLIRWTSTCVSGTGSPRDG